MILNTSDLFIARREQIAQEQVFKEETRLTSLGQHILDDVQTTPARVVAAMKELPHGALVPVRECDIVEVLICESFRKIGTQGEACTPADAVSVRYISEFIAQLVAGTLTENRRSILHNPYVVDHLKTRDYQTAGDTAVYGYLFLQEKHRQQLTPNDYLHMAAQSYLKWYGKQPTSIGYLLSKRVARYLPTLQGALQKVFPEVAPPLLRLV